MLRFLAMELGTGIFLASCVIGLVLLFNFTKDRWRWKRIVLWVFLFPLILAGGIWGGILGWEYYEDNRPLEPATRYMGLELGIPEADVLFLIGEPDEQEEMDNGTVAFRYGTEEETDRLTVGIDCGTVRYIYASEPVYGLTKGSTLEEVLSTLGEPEDVTKETAINTARLYHYRSMNLMLPISAGRVLNPIFMRQTRKEHCASLGVSVESKASPSDEASQESHPDPQD